MYATTENVYTHCYTANAKTALGLKTFSHVPEATAHAGCYHVTFPKSPELADESLDIYFGGRQDRNCLSIVMAQGEVGGLPATFLKEYGLPQSACLVGQRMLRNHSSSYELLGLVMRLVLARFHLDSASGTCDNLVPGNNSTELTLERLTAGQDAEHYFLPAYAADSYALSDDAWLGFNSVCRAHAGCTAYNHVQINDMINSLADAHLFVLEKNIDGNDARPISTTQLDAALDFLRHHLVDYDAMITVVCSYLSRRLLFPSFYSSRGSYNMRMSSNVRAFFTLVDDWLKNTDLGLWRGDHAAVFAQLVRGCVQIGAVIVTPELARGIITQLSGRVYRHNTRTLDEATLSDFMEVMHDPSQLGPLLSAVNGEFVAWGSSGIEYKALRAADGLMTRCTIETGNGATLLPGIVSDDAVYQAFSTMPWQHIRSIVLCSSISFRAAADYMYSWAGLTVRNEESYDLEALLEAADAYDGVDITEEIVCYNLAVRAYAKNWSQWISVFASCSAYGRMIETTDPFSCISQIDLYANKWIFDSCFVDICLTYVQQRVLLPPEVWPDHLYEVSTASMRTTQQYIKTKLAADSDQKTGALSHVVEYAAGPGYAVEVTAQIETNTRVLNLYTATLSSVINTHGFRHTLIGAGVGCFGKRCGIKYLVKAVPARRVDWENGVVYMPGAAIQMRRSVNSPAVRPAVSLNPLYGYEQAFSGKSWAEHKYHFDPMEHFSKFIKIDDGTKTLMMADFPSEQRK